MVPGGGGHFCVGAARADGIKMTWDKLGDAGIAPIGEVVGFPGVRVGLGECRGVFVTDVVHGVNPGKVRVEGGAFVLGSSRGGGFVLGLGGVGRRGLGSQGGARGDGAYPM